jgi:hypothetical protein
MAVTGAAAGDAADPAWLAMEIRRWSYAGVLAGSPSVRHRGRVWSEYAAVRLDTRIPTSYPLWREPILRAALCRVGNATPATAAEKVLLLKKSQPTAAAASAQSTQATLHAGRDARAKQARLGLRVELGAVVHESLGRVGLAVARRRVQRGEILRTELRRCGAGGCVAAAQETTETPRRWHGRRRGVERGRGRRVL